MAALAQNLKISIQMKSKEWEGKNSHMPHVSFLSGKQDISMKHWKDFYLMARVVSQGHLYIQETGKGDFTYSSLCRGGRQERKRWRWMLD